MGQPAPQLGDTSILGSGGPNARVRPENQVVGIDDFILVDNDDFEHGPWQQHPGIARFALKLQTYSFRDHDFSLFYGYPERNSTTQGTFFISIGKPDFAEAHVIDLASIINNSGSLASCYEDAASLFAAAPINVNWTAHIHSLSAGNLAEKRGKMLAAQASRFGSPYQTPPITTLITASELEEIVNEERTDHMREMVKINTEIISANGPVQITQVNDIAFNFSQEGEARCLILSDGHQVQTINIPSEMEDNDLMHLIQRMLRCLRINQTLWSAVIEAQFIIDEFSRSNQ
jgi:hypothetical protein